jgi:uncharacterized protein YndB with AHSA1/START domain
MITYEGEIVIDRPAAEVFAYATDPDKFALWTDVNSITRLSPGDAVGSRYQMDMGKGPMRATIVYKTVQLDPGRRWAMKTDAKSPIGWDSELAFEALGPTSTRMRSTGEVTLHGWRRLLEPLVRGELRKNEQAELVTLKGILEGTAGVGS